MLRPLRGQLLFALMLFSWEANAQSWLALQPTGGPPSARSQATTVWDSGTNRLILFAGTTDGCATSSALNDIWLLTKANGQGGAGVWSQAAASGTPPSARQSHTAVYNATSNRMIVYGGDACGTPTDGAVYVLTNANGNAVTPTWIAALAVSGTPDVVPSHHTATYDTTNNVMTVVLSGAAPAEAWALTHADGNGGMPTWTQLAGTNLFTAIDHAAVYDPSSNNVIVMDAATANVFLLSHANGIGGASAWTMLSVPGAKPQPRVGANAAYDTTTNRLIIFGGKTSTGQVNDVWVLNHANGTGGTPTWEQLSPTGLAPGPRGGTNKRASATYDTATQLMTMFGGGTEFGANTTFNNDSWILTLPPFCGYAISPQTQWFSSTGGANSIAMTADMGCGWMASGPPAWIHLTSGTSGTGNGTINYTVDSNSSATGRAGTITAGGRTFVVTEQGTAGCSTNSISPTSASFNNTGGTGAVLVTSFCQWTATSNDPAIVINSQTDAGDGSVQYTVDPGFQFSRAATMTIAGQTFTVNLNGPCSISLNSLGRAFPSAGGTGSFSFTETGNCNWGVSSNTGWLTITSSTTGSGSGTVNFSVAANPGGVSRTGTVTIGGQAFTVRQSLPLGDFNGDGAPDLVWQNDSTRQVTVQYYGGAQGAVFQGWNWLRSTGIPGWTVVGAADFNGDGVPDLIWQNDTTRQVTVHFYGGAQGAVFQGWAWLNSAGIPGWKVVGAADFNGDGVPDLIWQNDNSRQVTVHYYGGAQGAVFQGWAWLNAAGIPGWKVGGAADFNGDGVPDLLWQNDTTRGVTVHYYGGAQGAVFQGWNYLNSDGVAGWTVVGANDFDKNGTPDLVWLNDTTRQATVHFYNHGSTSYTAWAWLNKSGIPGWHLKVPR